MSRIVCPGHADEPAPGGLMVCVEVQGAYTDGSSRHERVFVPWYEARDDRLTAILAAHNREADVAGVDLDAHAASPGVAKALLERRVRSRGEEWDLVDRIRRRAVERGSPAAVINALTNAEDLAWARLLAAINEWRQA